MAHTEETAEDAMAEPELTGRADPGHTSVREGALERNAFAELMSTSNGPKAATVLKTKSSKHHAGPAINNFAGRYSLGAYLRDPGAFSNREVIYYNNDFVALNDAFPKASVHTLLLPRNPHKALLHPFDAFEDTTFLAAVKTEVKQLEKLVASELRRRFSKSSALEKARIEAMNKDPPPDELPPGRDWEKEIMTGVHSGPSMKHLHVHVLSVDHHSECMKHKKHYNSFTTPFLVRLDEFPLGKDDIRRKPNRGGYLSSDLVCWRCAMNFGNRFVQLKSHLNDEFEEWKTG